MSTPESPVKSGDQARGKSCEICKTRKVRCDRRQPSCTWCLRNGRRCVYTERKKPGVPSRLEWQMEEKMEALESNLQRLAERVNSYTSEQGERVPHPTVGFRLQPREHTASFSSSDSKRPYDQASATSGIPEDLNALEFSPGMLAEDPLELILKQHQLPPRSILLSMANLFFKDVATWAPLLPGQTINDVISSPFITRDDAVLLHGIVTATIRFSFDAGHTARDQSRYYNTSRQIVREYSLQNTSIRAIQAMTLVTIDTFGSSDGPEGRKMLALLHQSLKQMDLVKEKAIFLNRHASTRDNRFIPSTIPQPNSWLEEEERRRLVWIVYMLDRYATIGTQQGFTLPALHVLFPSKFLSHSSNSLPSSVDWYGVFENDPGLNGAESGSFRYHCELLTILSQIHEFLESPLDAESIIAVHIWRSKYRALDAGLDRWLSSLPKQIQGAPTRTHNPTAYEPSWVILQAGFILSVLRLNSPAAYPVRETEQFGHSVTARHRCLAAVDSLRKLTLECSQTYPLQILGYAYGYTLFVCASLLLVHAAVTEDSVDRTIWFFVSALETLGQRWPVVMHYSEALRSVLLKIEKDTAESSQIFSGHCAQVLTAIRRRGYEITLLSNKVRNEMDDEVSSHSISLEDLAAITVFGFFQFPVLESQNQETQQSFVTPTMTDDTSPVEEAAWHFATPNLGDIDPGMQQLALSSEQQLDWLGLVPTHEVQF